MTKPVVYIVVKDGLVQDVYVKAPFGADTEVVLYDLDGEDLTQEDLKELITKAHRVY